MSHSTALLSSRKPQFECSRGFGDQVGAIGYEHLENASSDILPQSIESLCISSEVE